MRSRGMLLSILFASRLGFYERLGWRSWTSTRTLLRLESPAGDADSASLPIRAFDPARDLGAVRKLHESYTGARQGAVVRDDAVWEASLRNGGNPREEFLVAERAGEPLAYLRATVLSDFLFVTELGRRADAAAPLAALVRRILAPRADDPLARPGRASAELRALAVAPPLADDELGAALAARGVEVGSHPDPNSMLRCLDGPGLAKALGTRLLAGEDETALLRRLLPPERFCYWPADRF